MQKSFYKPPAKCGLFLDLWHAHHKPWAYKKYLFDTSDLILHFDLGYLAFPIASKIIGHTQLNFFQVSSLFMSFVAFLSLFLVWFV